MDALPAKLLLYVYAGLLLVVLASATLLPGASEAALLGLLATGQGVPALLVAVATLGNVLGPGGELGARAVPVGASASAGGSRCAGGPSSASSATLALNRRHTGLQDAGAVMAVPSPRPVRASGPPRNG